MAGSGGGGGGRGLALSATMPVHAEDVGAELPQDGGRHGQDPLGVQARLCPEAFQGGTVVLAVALHPGHPLRLGLGVRVRVLQLVRVC